MTREDMMRSILFALGFLAAAAAIAVASIPAEAQNQRTRIIIKKRSYLDAGTTVKPGTARYHDYAYPLQFGYSRYGPGSPFGPSVQGDFPNGDGRWPLPGPFDLPGY